MNDRTSDQGASVASGFGAKRAWATIRHLPQSHRLPAFIVVFVAIILCSFIGSLVVRDGIEFLTSTPVVGFGVFSLIGVAVLFALPRSKFAGIVVGIFYLLPILYAALVLTLAILDRQTSGGLLRMPSRTRSERKYRRASVGSTTA